MGTVVLIAPSVNIKNTLLKYGIKITALITFIASLGISRLGIISNDYLSDLLVAIAFSVFLYTILHLKTSSNMVSKLKETYFKTSRKIAGFSFTLYLIHFPILIFLFALMSNFGMEKLQPTLMNIIIGCFICLAIIIIAYGLSLITENKTSQVRSFVMRRFKTKQGREKEVKKVL